jgi:L-fuculose-phosphate aldolase
MKQVISVRDLQDMLRKEGRIQSLPGDALLTPSARDMLRELEGGAHKAAPKAALAKSVNAKSAASDLEAFFNSPELREHKETICDIGRRMWQREYVDGNGGNISIRVGPEKDLVLCTPTLISKGFMKPEDMCLVDLEGNQLAGSKKRTSEILMHLQIMKRQPKALACVHCHPPYATGFAVAGVEPPTCLIPEYEIFCAVATAPYRTPGTPEIGKLVADLVDKHNTILMANHGVVAWSHLGIEDAYWRMEIIEAYCRTVLVASQLGKPLQGFSPAQLQDLLKIKQTLGFVDPRYGLKECELCDNNDWRSGTACEGAQGGAPDAETERLVQTVTDMIMERMKG